NKRKRKTKVKLPLLQKLIFALMQKIQERLSKETNIFPGQEMLDAVSLAEKQDIPYVFIDQNINITISRLMSEMGFFSKIKFLFYLLIGFIGIPFPWLMASKELDLNKVPEKDFIDEAMVELKAAFPAIYKVLVADRNKFMAKNIKKLGEKYDNVVVVVGAGHVKGIGKILEKE
ncbi:MAG: TraB/GumN family protein, partial [Candidatus Aenigmarchaeota archaeon]|nr:TraB/GumN family protein [Candidatus Aenigmarchaeota archaeon]